MLIKKILIGCLLSLVILTSCQKKRKKKPVYVGLEESHTEAVERSQKGDEVIVPYHEKGGLKTVPVKVNGISFDMILDTGCTIGTTLSLAEANYLYQKGKLTNDDVIGLSHALVADGSVVENITVNLKEVIIADRIVCYNVEASISKNTQAPLLLGNEVLNRLATVTIDNQNKTVIFKLK